MSIQQCAAVAKAVFPDVPIVTRLGTYSLPAVMVAIAWGQSRWEPRQAGDPLGEPGCSSCVPPDCLRYTSWGLWQIHNNWHAYLTAVTGSHDPCIWATWLYDPLHSAQAAYYVYAHSGTSPTARLDNAWGGALGSWEALIPASVLAQAVVAVQHVSSTGSTSGTTSKSKSKPTPTRSATNGMSPWGWVGLGSGVVGLGILAGWWWHTHPASFPRSTWARYDPWETMRKG